MSRYVDLRDAATALGLLLIAAGVGQVALWLAFAVPGLLIFLLAVVPPFLLPRRGGP